MNLTIFLDTGPLGSITNPKRTPKTIALTQWAVHQSAQGNRLFVPAVADYEVRRELERLGKVESLIDIDEFNKVTHDRYLPLTDSALHLAAKMWAQVRNVGTPTADPKELDCDVLIAAQMLDTGVPYDEMIIATSNVGHLSRFVRAAIWSDI